jgi:hypothetical protein
MDEGTPRNKDGIGNTCRQLAQVTARPDIDLLNLYSLLFGECFHCFKLTDGIFLNATEDDADALNGFEALEVSDNARQGYLETAACHIFAANDRLVGFVHPGMDQGGAAFFMDDRLRGWRTIGHDEIHVKGNEFARGIAPGYGVGERSLQNYFEFFTAAELPAEFRDKALVH